MIAEHKQIPGGLVVFFEGIDGVGKTTQLELAAESLRTDGWRVETTRGHGGTEFGELLRSASLSKAARPVTSDFYLSRSIHEALLPKIDENRAKGYITLIDRGPLSIAGYQMYGDGLDLELGWPAIENELKSFSPELNIIYTATVSVAQRRALERSNGKKQDYFESKPAGFFDMAQQGYIDAAERFGAVVIDAEQSIEHVHAQTQEAIQAVLAKKQSNKA